MVARSAWIALLLCLLGACNPTQPPVMKIALLAPFEGRYREIGYNALYSARLALADLNVQGIELLAVDDGGTTGTAQQRVSAIRQDAAIRAVILLGSAATAPDVQGQLPAIPALIVGYWGFLPAQENVFALTHAAIADLTSTIQPDLEQQASFNAQTTVPDLFALTQIPALIQGFDQLTIISSGSLPDQQFSERYRGNDPFAPDPGLLATLIYDGVGLLAQALQTGTRLNQIAYSGINGTIRFEGQFWQDAPINRYRILPDGTLAHAE